MRGIGHQIRAKRKAKSITIMDLASHLDVGQGYLAQVELGDVKPPQEEIERILSAIKNWRKEGPFTGDMTNPEDFKKFRKKCRMTIIELSEITGVSQAQIARFEQGEVGN